MRLVVKRLCLRNYTLFEYVSMAHKLLDLPHKALKCLAETRKGPSTDGFTYEFLQGVKPKP